MKLKSLLMLVLVVLCGSLCAEGRAADRTPSAPGASVAFGNLADGDVVPPAFVIRFAISGMGVAPAGSRIENTGHFHLLIDLAETPDFDLPLPANDQIRHYGKGQTQAELDLPEGEHTLQLMLADHAHVPHDPPVVSDVIRIVVANDAPLESES